MLEKLFFLFACCAKRQKCDEQPPPLSNLNRRIHAKIAVLCIPRGYFL